MWPLTAE